ncbi:MAG: hypothetical protein FJ308_22635 [Planctomycetes bacterium]|nr:hypothetical protein [Planctomycetota bacterium]
MDRFQTRRCSREQAGILTRNTWRVLQQNGQWLCIREPNVWISVMPGPDEHCEATVELLDARPDRFQDADEECRSVVATLFPEI